MVIDSFKGDYYFLSNFYPCTIRYDRFVFRNSESLFQSFKTNDLNEKAIICNMDGTSAKKYGKRVKLIDNWNDLRNEFMYETLVNKFCQNKNLAEKLLDTGDAILVEGNTWRDSYWGFYNGNGENYLGLILMLVRRELRDGTLRYK